MHAAGRTALHARFCFFKLDILISTQKNLQGMSSKDAPVTAGQLNEFARTLVEALDEARQYMHRRFDSIERRLSSTETRIDDIQTTVKSVKRDTALIPAMR